MSLQEKIQQLAKEIYPKVKEWRRHFHKNPELSFKEQYTAKYVCQILDKYNIPYTYPIAKTGVVAIIEGRNPSKYCVALRADMDALPIQEENQLPYASLNKGIMHACGHDMHTASLLGTTVLLHTIKDEFEGSIKCIFQPSEEKLPSGAQQMIKEGVLRNPDVSYIIGQHAAPELELGQIGFKKGLAMASADELYFTIKGKGGHAARPQEFNDTVLAASALVLNLQQLISRKKDPFVPGVLSIGKFIAKGATNIIPNQVHLAGTFRAMNEVFRKKMHKEIQQVANNTSKVYGVKCDVNIVVGSPTLENNIALTNRKIKEAENYNSSLQIVEIPARMGAEDFAYFSQEIPSLFYRVGVRNKKKGITSALHTPTFNMDEKVLEHSVGLMAWLAIKK